MGGPVSQTRVRLESDAWGSARVFSRDPSATPSSFGDKYSVMDTRQFRHFARWSTGSRSRRRPSAWESPSRPSPCRCARSRSGSAPSSSTAPGAGSSRPKPASASTAGAQRLLQLENDIVSELAEEATGALAGTFEIGASTGPGGVVLSQILCQFADAHPLLHIALSVFDTQTVVEHVADRTLQLGVVGAAPRHRGVEYEPFFRDTVVLACPPGHRFAGRSVSLDELEGETLIVMQEGAGVRQMIDDELQRAGKRLRDLNVRLELGLQESVTSAVRGGYGITFISRSAVENDLSAGTLVEARVNRLELEREIYLVRASGRAETRAARAFVEFAKEQLP